MYLFGMLAGCDAICVQAVWMPARLDVRRASVAPVADAVLGWLTPPVRPVHKASGVLCRVAPVVQH